MARKKQPTPLDVQRAVQQALEAERGKERKARAQRMLAESNAQWAAAEFETKQRRSHSSGGHCGRCGATHPDRWAQSTILTPGGGTLPMCQACADPQHGVGDWGWSRPVRDDEQAKAVLCARVFGLPDDAGWVLGFGRARGLDFRFAHEAGVQRASERGPWAHIDRNGWAPVVAEAGRRHRVYRGRGPVVGEVWHVEGDRIVTSAEQQALWLKSAFDRGEYNASGEVGGLAVVPARNVPRPTFRDATPEEREAEELRLLIAAERRVEADETAKRERLAQEAALAVKQRQRAVLARQHRQQVRELELKLRAELRAA